MPQMSENSGRWAGRCMLRQTRSRIVPRRCNEGLVSRFEGRVPVLYHLRLEWPGQARP